jgi:Ca-activated chloride channel family protein
MLSEQFLANFHFLRPEWGLLLLLPTITLALQWRAQQGAPGWDSIIAPHLLEALRLRHFRNRLFSPVSVALMLMLLMTLVAMGPSWRQQASPLTRDEAALIILLDTSNSMQQTDIQPSRLARARQKIADLLDLRAGSQTALLVYAGSAHTVLDLTDDGEILQQYLSAIDPRIMPRNGKFAEYTLPQVDRIIGDSTVPTTVLLITDGVSSATEQAFERWFDNRQHQLLVWGIGLEEAASDMAPLERRALESLTRGSGGRYIEISIDGRDVSEIERRVNAHYVVSADSAVPWLDSGYWLVFPCIALFTLWFRRGWTLQWTLAGLLFLGGLAPGPAHADNWFIDLWLSPDQQGRLLLEKGEYREAAEHFSNPEWKAVAYYYAEEFELAAEYFSRVDTPIARFNEANALAHGQHYLRAVAIYQELLEVQSLQEAAERNRQVVQDLIDAINNMSESQQPEGNGSRELGEDDPRRADGADETVLSPVEIEQLSADQILQDEKINEMWMRSVQRDPSYFLAVKFGMQLERQRGSTP